MSQGRWVLWAGLVIVLLLVWLPPALILVSGWPDAGAPTDVAPFPADRPIAGSTPPIGIDPLVTRWMLVVGACSLGLALGAWLLAWLLKRAGESAPWPRPALLGFLGLASLLVYVVDFLWPFPLYRYYSLKQISMGMIADRSGDVVLGVALGTVALFLLFALAHRLCRGQGGPGLWAVVLLAALAFAVVNCYVATTTTLDPYDYVARGRITGVHGGNPYVLRPVDYPNDPFMDYVSWREATSAYGPLWEMVSALLARAAGQRLWMNLAAHKGLALASYLLCALFIALTLRRTAPGRALSGTLLFAWNPLILMEGLANAHNDLLMAAFLLLALWVLSHARPLAGGEEPPEGRLLLYGALAVFFLAASILVKFVTVLFLPFFLFYLLRGEQRWSRWLRRTLLLLLPLALLIATYYAIFWKWPEVSTTLFRRVDMFRMSIASISREALLPRLEPRVLEALSRWPFLGLFFLSYLAVLGRALWGLARPAGRLGHYLALVGGGLAGALGGALFWALRGWAALPWEAIGKALSALDGLPLSLVLGALLGAGLGAGVAAFTRFWVPPHRPWDVLLLSCSSAFLLYLLLANFWFWPWYMVLSLALLALSGDERLFAPLTLSACAGELSHLGWNFVWYWWGISWDTVYQMDALVVLGIVGLPLIVYVLLGIGGFGPWRAPGEPRASRSSA